MDRRLFLKGLAGAGVVTASPAIITSTGKFLASFSEIQVVDFSVRLEACIGEPRWSAARASYILYQKELTIQRANNAAIENEIFRSWLQENAELLRT